MPGKNELQPEPEDQNEIMPDTVDFGDDYMKKQDEILKTKIESANDLSGVIIALKSHGRREVGDNLIDTLENLQELIKEKKEQNKLEDLKYTIDHILQSDDLFKGRSVNTYNGDIDKQLRDKLIECIKREMEST